MWKKIKSSFILQKIFSILNYNRKLNIIMNNKKIQRKLGINIIDIIRFSGRYKEEKDGKTKEFSIDKDKLVFEGQYANRKRNGYGKEYNEEGELLFEGEYLNGKRWTGNANEYDEDTGKLIFEIEYLNGERWTGKIKIIDDEEGDFILYMEKIDVKYLNGENFYKITDINGKIIQDLTNYNGLVKEYYEDNWLKFEGEFLNGKRNGKGKEYNYRTGDLEF